MLTDEKAAELADLRARAYGPQGGLDSAGAARLAALESALVDSRATHEEASWGVPASSDQPLASPAVSRTKRSRRPLWVLVATLAVAVAFAAGAVFGTSLSSNGRSPVADPQVGIPQDAADSFAYIQALRPWDPDSLQFVGSIRNVTVWVGYLRNGRNACAAFYRESDSALGGTQVACEQVDSDAQYPLQLQWVSTIDGLSETYSVILRESGETQLTYSTT